MISPCDDPTCRECFPADGVYQTGPQSFVSTYPGGGGGSGRAAVDPSRIPQHVVDAAWRGFASDTAMREAVAAALDVLMDDEPFDVPVWTFKDALTAVLAREAKPSPPLGAVDDGSGTLTVHYQRRDRR